ncbi:MAG: ATP-binding protein [Planctomycetes bacterium]|nr:ATP-binding protein [Planctomycetota bacterium]MCL4731342.1 ATP-binding protein [Planctomycetota bacterium]
MIQTTRRELDVPLDTRSLAPLREFVREVLGEGKLGAKVARLVVIAIDEACSSIILNAKEQGAQGNLRLLIDIDPTRVKIHISDTGNDYDVGDITRDELLKEFTRSKKTELGTFLIRRVMDEFSYKFKKGFQSEIEMLKFLYESTEPQAN